MVRVMKRAAIGRGTRPCAATLVDLSCIASCLANIYHTDRPYATQSLRFQVDCYDSSTQHHSEDVDIGAINRLLYLYTL